LSITLKRKKLGAIAPSQGLIKVTVKRLTITFTLQLKPVNSWRHDYLPSLLQPSLSASIYDGNINNRVIRSLLLSSSISLETNITYFERRAAESNYALAIKDGRGFY
jgi:hypothetical protein